MNITNQSEYIDTKRFRQNLGIMSLFSLPVIYLGIILAVFIHEVIGHGLTTMLLGGRFNGFGIAPDGLGWAKVDVSGLPPIRIALVLLGGVLSTTIFSLACFGAYRAFKRRQFAALTCLFFGLTALLDGLPYFFWDAVYLGGIGDFSGIWNLYHREALRLLVIGVSGPLMALVIAWFNVAYYRLAYAWLGEGRQVRLRDRLLIALVILLLQVAGWLEFDWDQLIPGIGLVPSISALAVVLVTLAWIVASYRPGKVTASLPERRGYKIPMLAAWVACAGVVFVILQWLWKGVSFF